MRTPAPILAITLTISLLPALVTAAGTSTATCFHTSDWMLNSRNQTPCMVAASLQAQCTADNQWAVDPIVPPNPYARPTTDANPCRCSSVTYNLLSACTRCQGYGDFLIWFWKDWINRCTGSNAIPPGQWTSVIPEDIAIPQWAYMDPTKSKKGEFDMGAAQGIGRDPENISPAYMSSSSVSVARQTSAITTTTAIATATDPPTKKHVAKVIPIVVAIVGSAVFLALVILLPMWCLRRRKNNVITAEHDADLARQEAEPLSLGSDNHPLDTAGSRSSVGSSYAMTYQDFANRLSYFEPRQSVSYDPSHHVPPLNPRRPVSTSGVSIANIELFASHASRDPRTSRNLSGPSRSSVNISEMGYRDSYYPEGITPPTGSSGYHSTEYSSHPSGSTHPDAFTPPVVSGSGLGYFEPAIPMLSPPPATATRAPSTRIGGPRAPRRTASTSPSPSTYSQSP